MQRHDFLCQVGEAAGRAADYLVEIADVARLAGLTTQQGRWATQSFIRGGYLRLCSDGKHVILTPQGVEAVKKSRQTYTLKDRKGQSYESPVKGTFGGHDEKKIYGRMGCPNAQRWLEKGYYKEHRVFFLDEPTAAAAGYRPCYYCMRERFAAWKQARDAGRPWPEVLAGILANQHQ